MIKLDDDLLAELGLAALSPEDKKRMLAHIYETLEMRVGMQLAKQMTDEQLNEFESFISRNDEAGALRWLEANFPNYKEVVAAEFEKLKLEVKQFAPQILRDAAASAQQQVMAGSEPQQLAPSAPMTPPAAGQSTQPQAPQQSAAWQPEGVMPQQPPAPTQSWQGQQPPLMPPGSPGQSGQTPGPDHRSDYDLAG